MSLSQIVPDDIAEAAALIRSREITCRELVDGYLERIEQAEPAINAFITIAADQARESADAADAMLRAGSSLGPLHGLPVGIKDNIDTAGIRTTSGSGMLRENVPGRDATVIDRLKRAGAIVIGKTNLHEFAWGGSTENEHFGATKNPWDISRNSAGSSGGSGAAVAAGECLFSLGTDTGGSIRLPAAAAGISGLRPTVGRVSNAGVMPLAWTMDTVGPLARTVDDVALIHGVIAGYDPADQASSGRAVPEYVRRTRGLQGARLGIIKDFSLAKMEPAVEAATRTALHEAQTAGAEIIEIDLGDISQFYDAWLAIHVAEPSAVHQQRLRENPDALGADVRALLQAGEFILATDYIQAQRYRSHLRARFLAAFEGIDAFLTPTAAAPAAFLGASPSDFASGLVNPTGERNFFTGLPSVLGFPALSVPCGFADGIPLGMQIIGRPFDETGILAIGSAYQGISDWHSNHAPLFKTLCAARTKD
jgi:aspartyl-tRNA(Asn)/glutamyl-tRNA(Gln) amidotransferase subunit A